MNSRTQTADEVLSPRQVCEQYPVFRNPQALAELRWRKEGPDYIKTNPGRGGRCFYRRSAIESWLDARTVRSGGQRAA
jgi:hypothetical protein